MKKQRKRKKVKSKKTEIKQLDLGFSEKGFLAPYKRIGIRFMKWLSYFEVIKFTKDGYIWLLLTLSSANTLFQGFLYIKSAGKLPEKLPLLTFYTRLDLKLLDSSYLILIPLLSLVVTLLVAYHAFKNYHREKEVGYILMTLSAISLSAISFHLLKLILPFI